MIVQEEKKNIIIKDLTRNIRLTDRFHIWMGFLTLCLIFCLFAYYKQIRYGLGVTGMRDYVSWGIYISTFIFFVATSLTGMLICSILVLLGQKWIAPLVRISEIIALSFAVVAGLAIIADMGHPERLLYIFIYGRFKSPVLWDVVLLIVYTIICLLLYFIPLIPDAALLHERSTDIPSWQRKTYRFLSFNWKGSTEQNSLMAKAMKILLIMIIPAALAIHTITSWLFALTPRAGWNSTIFGPYFVTGAFVTGVSAMVLVMYIFRKIYGLKDYITNMHFDKIARLFVLVSLIYLYFSINKYIVPAYKMQKYESVYLHELVAGRYAPLFWTIQITGLILPTILLLFNFFRKPLQLFIISIFVFTGSWFIRYLIVVPVMENPFLPAQNLPEKFVSYTPTPVETTITIGIFIVVIMIISILSKLFPVIPVYQTIEATTNETAD